MCFTPGRAIILSPLSQSIRWRNNFSTSTVHSSSCRRWGNCDDFSTVFVPLSLGGVATCSVVKIGLDVWRPCLASTKKKKRVYRFIFHCQLWGPLLHIEYSQVLASLGTDETSFLLDVPRPGLYLQFWRTFVLWPSTSHPGSWTENGVKNIHLRSP